MNDTLSEKLKDISRELHFSGETLIEGKLLRIVKEIQVLEDRINELETEKLEVNAKTLLRFDRKEKERRGNSQKI